MANHKWEDVSLIVTNAPQREKCVKCGIERVWLYGDMQCWEYIDFRLPIGDSRISLHRPPCTPILPMGTSVITRKGEYI